MMRRRCTIVPSLALALAVQIGCAHPPASAPATPAEKGSVTIDPQALSEGSLVVGAWVLYGATRVRLYEARLGRFRNQSGDDFALELGARAALADFWAAERHQADKANAYLDLLVDLRQAGHLDEYVISFFGRPGWTVPGDALAEIDLAAFEGWGRTRLANHQPVTLADVHPTTAPRYPAVPGDTLPKARDLSPKVVPCASAAPRITAALESWAKEEATLDGAPLAAASRAEFARLVGWARDQREFRTRGVTWVSPTPADLHYLLGFCAADRHDYAAAGKALAQSVRLGPLSPTTRLELAHVLVQGKRFDDADRLIDGVLATTQDRCHRAHALRQRGYILVERGRLEEAYAAYQKSLEHEPTSQLAVRQMVFIATEIQRLGGAAARAFKPYQPPPAPAGQQLVTECAEQ